MVHGIMLTPNGFVAPDAGVISLLRATRLGRVEQEAPSGPLSIANVRTPAKNTCK